MTRLTTAMPAAELTKSGRGVPSRGDGPGDRRSDRDVSASGILVRDRFVVEPDPALGQVAEVQGRTRSDGHRRAAGAVRPPPQWMGERIPGVEVTHHRDGPIGGIAGQREGYPHGAVTPRLRSLDQLLLHSCIE